MLFNIGSSILDIELIRMPISIPYSSPYFRLYIDADKKKTSITMDMLTPFLTTKSLENVKLFFLQNIPGILKNRCFNDANLPFEKEIEQTELGHLFEHMILEFLCREKRLLGYSNVLYNGRTRWNWEKERKGIFHIAINTGTAEKEILNKALVSSVDLINKLLDNSEFIKSAGSYVYNRPLQTEVFI